MNIGDRVRFIHGSEEGIVTKLLPQDVVEVEIEEGFKIPVLRRELTLIAREEQIVFGDKKKTEKEDKMFIPPQVQAENGLYLAFLPFNDQQLIVYLINNTDIEWLCTCGEIENETYRAIAAAHLKKRDYVKLYEANLQNFEKWSALMFQCLAHRLGYTSPREPLIRKMKFSANSFFKQKRVVPILNKEGFVFQIDQQESKPLEIQKVRESMLSPKEAIADKNKVVANSLKRPSQQIDLHAEKLLEGNINVPQSHILGLQLEAFEKAIEGAYAANMDEITFIHGVGNGVLRQEIHKRLSKKPYIRFYQDAQKEKFGYGATLVKLK